MKTDHANMLIYLKGISSTELEHITDLQIFQMTNIMIIFKRKLNLKTMRLLLEELADYFDTMEGTMATMKQSTPLFNTMDELHLQLDQ